MLKYGHRHVHMSIVRLYVYTGTTFCPRHCCVSGSCSVLSVHSTHLSAAAALGHRTYTATVGVPVFLGYQHKAPRKPRARWPKATLVGRLEAPLLLRVDDGARGVEKHANAGGWKGEGLVEPSSVTTVPRGQKVFARGDTRRWVRWCVLSCMG